MKKIIASIAFLCYITVTCGVMVNFHYCMNRLASMQFFVTENKTCPTCGMHINKSHGCCRDEVKVVKLQTSHLVSQINTPDFPLAVRNFTSSSFLLASFINFTETEKSASKDPPLIEEEVYLQNCVFRL